MRNIIRIFPLLVVFLLLIPACELFEGYNLPDETPGETGWAGIENDAQIQDDILFFGGSNNLPDKVDLSPYLPPVMNQGQYGICVGCAISYNQKTALNALDGQWNSYQLADAVNQSSPIDLFLSIDLDKRGDLQYGECSGTHFQYAYEMLQARGAADCETASFVSGSFNCDNYPATSWTQKAASNRIENWRQIPVEIDVIREKLTQGLPVAFGALIRQDFVNHKYGVLETNNGSQDMHHAMLVVGYDDDLKAFKIVNSWGTGYHDSGFAWIGYDLFIRDFCKYAFVAYNSINPPDPVDPVTQSEGADLRAWIYSDWRTNGGGALMRNLNFDIFNIGTRSMNSTPAWDVVYLYFNAYNMNDYGVILHHRITAEFGSGMGPFTQGMGSSGNWWSNIFLSANNSLGKALFGPQSGSISWNYTMPPITGDYYMVLIADVFNVIGEPVEQDNFYFLTNQFGGPIHYENGNWFGFKAETVDARSKVSSIETSPHTPVNASNMNAYTTKELRFFLQKMKANGQLKSAIENYENSIPSSGN